MNENPVNDRFHEACRIYGLHPFVALSLFGIDQMLFGAEVLSGGMLIVFSVLVSLLMILPITLIQRNAYKDDGGTALGKAVLCAILTAIPTGLPALFTGAWGIAGWVGLAAKRRQEGERNRARDDDDTHNSDHYGAN